MSEHWTCTSIPLAPISYPPLSVQSSLTVLLQYTQCSVHVHCSSQTWRLEHTCTSTCVHGYIIAQEAHVTIATWLCSVRTMHWDSVAPLSLCYTCTCIMTLYHCKSGNFGKAISSVNRTRHCLVFCTIKSAFIRMYMWQLPTNTCTSDHGGGHV